MEEKKELKSPLRKEIIKVTLVPKEGAITDPKHVLFGGMAEAAARTFTVPIIASTGVLKNVLTNEEKEYFEDLMGVNLSVHNKKDNYWENFKVRLTKQANYLDLSVPEDYLKYKVLLANTNFICPSLQEYNEKPLATYQFIISTDKAELQMASNKRNLRRECYKLAGKIENDYDILKTVVEALDKRPVADNTDIKFLANKLDESIDLNAKAVYAVLTDSSLATQVLIKKAIGKKLIAKNGDFYYLKSGKTKVPMCEEGKDPILKQAIKFLENPKNQEIKFNLEAQINSGVIEED